MIGTLPFDEVRTTFNLQVTVLRNARAQKPKILDKSFKIKFDLLDFTDHFSVPLHTGRLYAVLQNIMRLKRSSKLTKEY